MSLLAYLMGRSRAPTGSLFVRGRDLWRSDLMLSGLSLLVYLGGQKARLIMWQRSHGCWPSLMRRKVCLTNYPGGRSTCFFFFPAAYFHFFRSPFHTRLLFSFFSPPPQLVSARTELWHLRGRICIWISAPESLTIDYLSFRAKFCLRAFFCICWGISHPSCF